VYKVGEGPRKTAIQKAEELPTVTGVYSLSKFIVVSVDTLTLRSTAVDPISVSKDTRSKYLYQ